MGLLLLCLTAGVVTLYQRLSATGSSGAAPEPAPSPPAPPAAAAADPGPAHSLPRPAVAAALPDDEELAGADGRDGKRTQAGRRSRRAEGNVNLDRERPLGSGTEAAAAAEPAAELLASPPPASPAPKKNGNVAIRVQPKLGDTLPSFEILKVTTIVDGRVLATSEGQRFAPGKVLEVFRGTVNAGEHALEVVAEYRGNSHGLFSYFEHYRYTARSSLRFLVDEGASSEITVDLLDTGRLNTDFEKRLAIAFVKNGQ